jgi:small subunit ribosomal protein S20
MANHVSALKRARQTVKRTAVNRFNKSHVRKSLRSLREAITKGDTAAVTEQYNKTVSALDKSVRKGVLHQNTASRYKARLHARVKALSTKAA